MNNRRFKSLLFIGFIASMISLYILFCSRVMTTRVIDEFDWNEKRSMAALDNVFPSKKEIYSSLSDQTFLVSGSIIDNAIYYYDKNNRFFILNSSGLLHGVWWTRWSILPMTYRGTWRFRIVNVFCQEVAESAGGRQSDTCIVPYNKNNIKPGSPHLYKQENGDAMGLVHWQGTAFPALNKPLSLDDLSNAVSHYHAEGEKDGK